MTATELASAFASLSAEDKLKLIELLWDSLTDSEKQWDLTPAQETLFAERLADYSANRQATSTWEEVKAAARSRIR